MRLQASVSAADSHSTWRSYQTARVGRLSYGINSALHVLLSLFTEDIRVNDFETHHDFPEL